MLPVTDSRIFRLVWFFILVPFISIAQGPVHKYFVKFTDKNGSSFSTDHPLNFLSPKAIDRRIKWNIPVTEEDLPVNESYVNVVKATGANLLTRSKWFNGISIECDSVTLQSIFNLSFVESTKLILRPAVPGINKYVKNESNINRYSSLNSSGFDYGESYNQIHLMHGESLHDNGFTGKGILIAVLDAGFYNVNQFIAFDSMRMNQQIIATWDFVSGDSSVYDNSTHGMEVLSTIAGNVSGKLIGTAPAASFLLLRSEDENTESLIEEYNWNSAAEYADSAGADIISSSLGYTLFDDSTFNHTYLDMDGNHCPSSIAADKAASKGMLVITSAGNSGSSAWHFLSAPSDGDSVLSVGAVDQDGNFASFSSFGPASDGDVKPNVAAKGLNSTMANPGGGISDGSGTSFSCPILAGSAACLWQSFPDRSAMQIKKAIERSSNYFFAPNDSLGYGIPDFRIASYFLSTGNTDLPREDVLLDLYPNPFSEKIQLNYFSAFDQVLLFEIYNSIGQIVYSETKQATKAYINNYSFYLDGEISKGIYFLKIQGVNQSFIRAAIKN